MGGDEKEDEIPQRCLVYARLRPTKALDGIGKDGVYQLVHCNKKKIILGTPEEPIKTFNFDGSFTPANTQEEIFNEVAVASLDHVLKGFTSAIMCYGQTGTGKSYTMSHKSPGQEAIIPRSANYLFAKIKDMPTKEFHLSAHFVQIYRDTLSDLMVDPKEKQKVDIRFQDKTGVEIVNCTEVPVTSTEQFMAMYEEGDARRVVRPTKMNPDSSRGHTALVLYVKSKSVDPNDMSMPANGKITFIDLAGYERFEKTGLKDPVHIDEAKKINASLLALGYVVTALSNGDKHVPWRNSKLTRLLQDSIGGKSRSTIVITCGPASTNLHESQNSFDFGNRAMAVKVAAKLDVAVDYQKLSVKLQQQLDEQEEKLSKLEKAEKERDVERAATQDRHKRDMERLRTRHKDELVKLMEEGATNERVQKLIEMQDAETETLEDMQHDEQAVQEETFQEVVKEEMNERVQRERIRGSSMRKQISDDKRKELHAAYTLIAQLRAGSADLPDDETLKKIHDEVSGLAGSAKTPALAHLLVNTGAPPAGGLTIDAPMVQETGEDEGASQATSACPSPTTVNNAEIGILKQELVDMRQQLEETEQKGKEAIEKMKVAQKKAATKLKEERERNAQLLKTTASLEKMEALEGELDEVKTAKKEAERMLEEANERVEKLEKNLNGVTARVWRTTIETKKTQAKVEALSAERDELDEKYSILEQEKAELADEFNRKKRDIEIAAEEADAGASRVHGELKNELDAAKEKIAEHEAAIEEMTQKLGAVTKELEDLSTAKDEQEAGLRAEIEAAKGEASTSAKELEEGQAALAKRAEEVEADLAARQEELDDMVETTKDEVATVRAELMKQVEDMQSRTSLEVIGLKERIDELMGEMVQLKEDAENAKEQLAAAKDEAAAKEEELEEKNKALEEEVEAAKEEAEDERELGKELAEEKEALQLELEEYKDQSEAALAEKERQEEELQNNVASLEDELATSGQYQEALEVRIKELEGALSELTGELNQEKSKAQVEAEAAKNKMMEERKMRDEEAERLKAEAERLKTDAAKDAEEMEKRMREEQAEAERRLKEEKEKVGGGKYKYTSKIVSQLERVGQFAIPRDAPSMARPEGLLVSLDPEEVKASLAYNLVVVGLQHSGKSSVQHCLVKGSHGLVRRAPDTTSPTTAFDLSRTVHKERSGGGGGFLGKKQASASANTHFTVWDTPCDPRHIAALPPGTLPVLGACYVVTFSLTDDFAGIAKRLEYVLQMVWANAKANMDEGMRLPVLLVGTRRDLLSSKDNVVVMKKIGEAKRWLKEAPMMRERFTLLDCFAVSCKEWSVQGDTGLKTGVSSFSQLMGFLSSDMANRYPITPPALLGEVENAGAQLDIHDWWTSLARSNPRDEADATLRAGHKAVLSLMLHLHRMRLRNVWLVGKMEFEAAVFDHIPSHVEKAQPFLKDQLKKICVQRGMAYTVLDKAMNDAREGVVLLKTDVLANFVASFLLPTVYLSNCTAFAEREKPGYLKGVLAKHAKLNIEEVWRPDWPLMFDGKVPQSTAPALMKAAPAFEKEVRLGCDFLPLLDLSFEVFSEDDNEKYQFMPAMALRHLSNTVVSMLLECFKKSNGGWIANTTKCDPLAYAETQAVLKGVHALNPGTARLWGDGAAVMVDGRWAFVRVEPAHVVICCEGKDSPLLAPLRQVVVAASAKANISDATWKDGMNLDHLPRLAPAYAKQVEDAASIEAFLAHLSADILRGTPYPQATVDKDIKRRGK
eukprot:TRINITY_DN3188_c0_g1_i11.p1 TRINITY_DN3188_c0_g1~~TRINITY_DN3188_c0_g1_i11.p1  ORF type:complete len:1749 (+),score=834.00 TRINITY_DN3188_c0_g1_i11:162-5408(+)